MIIGAGWIGLEVAAAARKAGARSRVLEMADLPLVGVLGPEMAEVFADLHRDNGVDLRLGARRRTRSRRRRRHADRRAPRRRRRSTPTRSSSASASRPKTRLARRPASTLDNGVLVDASLRTSDPDVYAVGDVANHDHPVLRPADPGRALGQRAQPAGGRGGGDARRERAAVRDLPYFFSDQYDLGMEYVGYAPPAYDQVVVRGDTGKREFVAFWLDGEHAHPSRR